MLGMPSPKTVAIVLTESGAVYDHCWTWETGQCYANLGYRVVAVADVISRFDGSVYIDMTEAQEIYDHERALAADCFGPGIRD